MNDDHKDDNIAIASHFLKLSGVTGMRMLDLDKLGVNVEVRRLRVRGRWCLWPSIC
jgi:hypothetical protein